MSAAAKVLITDFLQPYQQRFLGMDIARTPDRGCRVVSHRAEGPGFTSNIFIIDEIGYDDCAWAAIKPMTKEGAR